MTSWGEILGELQGTAQNNPNGVPDFDGVRRKYLTQRRLVGQWSRTYMFNGDKYAARKARRVTKFFGDHHIHRSHSLGIDRTEASEKGVKIVNLEVDLNLEDAVLSVYYATFHTFSGPAIKIVENQLGHAFVKVAQQVQMGMQGMIPMLSPPPPVG